MAVGAAVGSNRAGCCNLRVRLRRSEGVYRSKKIVVWLHILVGIILFGFGGGVQCPEGTPSYNILLYEVILYEGVGNCSLTPFGTCIPGLEL
jgi:hypothetical protein